MLKKRKRKQQFWTGEEIQVLRDLYVQQGWPAVQKMLPHRSLDQIRCQARHTGLRAPAGSTQQRSYAWVKDMPRDPVTGQWMHHEDAPDPTPEEISERCRAVRENW